MTAIRFNLPSVTPARLDTPARQLVIRNELQAAWFAGRTPAEVTALLTDPEALKVQIRAWDAEARTLAYAERDANHAARDAEASRLAGQPVRQCHDCAATGHRSRFAHIDGGRCFTCMGGGWVKVR